MATTPGAGEPVTKEDGRVYRAVREGLAQILAPYRNRPMQETAATTTATAIVTDGEGKPQAKTSKQKLNVNNDEGDQAVFYNPIQQYNRDLSVLAILTYGEGAVLEKTEKLEKRRKGRGKVKAKVIANANANLAPRSTSDGIGSRKRKADDVEEAEVKDDDKRAKTQYVRQEVADEGEEEDELEIRQLGVEEVTASDGADQQKQNTMKCASTDPAEPHETRRSQEPKKIHFTILDALSASGLRAIRYAKEIPFATNVVANDISPEAVRAIEFNIDHNELRGKVHSNVGDARAYMYGKVGNELEKQHAGYVHRFDVVDLDPYGTAAPFLDSAVQALADGGLLCVTMTDAGVWASNGYPEKAYSLYGGVTMKGPHSHEGGLRLILHAVASSAAKYGIAIEPLLSLSIDFYARLFIRVHKSQQDVKLLAGTTMMTYNCDFGCGAWSTQLVARNQSKTDKIGQEFFKHSYAQGPSVSPHCDQCGRKMHLGGPMWAGPLHNPYFVQRMLEKLDDVDRSVYQTVDRMRGMLTLAMEEDLTMAASNTASLSAVDSKGADSAVEHAPFATRPALIPRLPPQTIDRTPFFFVPTTLAKVLSCVTPPEDALRGAIRSLGYKVTRSHCKAGSFKTDAPWDVVWEIMREWVRQKAPIKEGAIKPGTSGASIMQKMRGSVTSGAVNVGEQVQHAIAEGVESKDKLKRILEAALYRLDHPSTENGESSPSEAQPLSSPRRDVSKLKIVFDAEIGKEKPRGKLVRYQINPREHWGPMHRAEGG